MRAPAIHRDADASDVGSGGRAQEGDHGGDLGRIGKASGRDDASRVESALTWRVAGPHAIGVNYVWSHRSAAFPGGVEERQTLGQFGIFYTLLGRQDFGTVDWRHAD